MPDSWIAEQTRTRQRERQRNAEMVNGAPWLGFITGSSDPENELVTVSYHAGERKFPNMHPFTGADSWIRTAMESGQQVVMAQRPDAEEPELLAYSFKDPKLRIKAFGDGQGLYRPLTPGEIDIHSKGAAQTYYSRRPLLEHRAGLIRSWLNQDELQSGAKAPVHVRFLHLHKSDAVGDEERFGVVQRPDESAFLTKFISADREPSDELTQQTEAAAGESGIEAEQGPFAKEHTRILLSGASFPEKLIDVREGDVIDDEGNVVNLSASGEPLRYKGEWFMQSEDGGVFFVGIDDLGNFSVHAPDEAETGGDINIPMGELIINIGKSWINTVEEDFTLSCTEGGIEIDCKADYNTTVKEGAHSLTITEGDMEITVSKGSQTTTVESDITVESKVAVHIKVGGTEIHIEDGKIELGSEGAADKIVLDSKLQDELGSIADTIKELKSDFNSHKHMPGTGNMGIPIPGESVLSESSASYDKGETNSEIVTTD